MAAVRPFQVSGLKIWFWSRDHEPPHFHAKRAGEWEVKVYFLRQPEEMIELEWASKRPDPPSIVDAWLEDGQLVLLSPEFERLSVPLEELFQFIGNDQQRVRAFEIDEDGRFLYWPHADVHLGWSQFRQIIDPAAALADRQKSAEFNRRYGAAIRSLREEAGLKQADVPGLTARHLRRVEHGEQPASKAALEALATAHGMPLAEYLKELARRSTDA